jgi:hypothetical protein
LDDPLDFIGSAALGAILLIAVALFWGLERLMKALGPTKPKVVCLELPGSTKRANEIIGAWKRRDAVDGARYAIYVDFAYLIAYGVLIAAIGSLLGRADDNEDLGALVTYIGLAAPLLDAAENSLMLAMLKRGTGQPLPALTTLVAGVKWVLIVVAAVAGVVLLAQAVV